jgi:aspartate/methionine/tyrosine aminotransferase
MERVKHYTSICGAAPSELLAQIALKARDRILARNRGLIARNLALLEGFFAEHADLFAWYLPDGGCIGFPRYLGGEGVEVFASRLVEQSGVLLLPASVYKSDLGATSADRFRIGYGRANMEAGLEAMRAHLREQAA